MPLVGSPWLEESVRYQLGPNDLVFEANECRYVCLESDIPLALFILDRPERCKTKLFISG